MKRLEVGVSVPVSSLTNLKSGCRLYVTPTLDPKNRGSQSVPQNSVAAVTLTTKQQSLKVQKALLLLLNYFNYFGVL